MSDEEIVKAFSKFIVFRRDAAEAFVRSKLLRHHDYSIPSHCFGSKSLVFGAMADDYTRGLIGELNRFLIGINHAECWVRVANEYPRQEKLGLFFEFVEPLIELSVGRSYSLRNQFIFAVTHLAHQSNMQARSGWPDKLPPDRKIDFSTLCVVNSGWIEFPDFLQALGLLNDEAFAKTTTKDFRNRLQHRARLHFDTGLNPFFERRENQQGVSYTYEITSPLNLEVILPELYKQHTQAVCVFQAYWNLLKELCAVWQQPEKPLNHASDTSADLGT